MKYSEEATLFGCAGDQLLGILARPDTPGDTGIVIIVGGPQYRVGSHRQFVLLSRRLAEAGFPTLRFDYRGMGDSGGLQRDFLAVSADIKAAIDTMQTLAPSVKRVALWGLCDGASAALLYCQTLQDKRIKGLSLLNPWIRSEASLAKTQVKHYYTRRLRQKEFWVKLVSGKVAASAVTGLMRSCRQAFTKSRPSPGEADKRSFQNQMAHAWHAFDGGMLLVLSGNDYTAKEFQEYVSNDASWTAALSHPRLTRRDCADADHTFSSHNDRATVEALTLDWLISQMDH